MGLYDRLILPRLLALAMRTPQLVPYRRRVAGAATGRVLEIGIGSGLNLPFYGPDVSSVTGIDPSPALLAMAGSRRGEMSFPVELLEGSAEALPLDAASADSVVTTWTLCSVPDPEAALREVRRVLRPGGKLLFVEHGRAPEPTTSRWQDRITPVWKHVAGGCHLNRKIDALILGAGFRMERLEAGYMGGPKVMTFMYSGQATPD
jgi:ubiquinone/menaquinone biosynthesis C-methylase UbiE